MRVVVSGDALRVLAGAGASEYRLGQVKLSPKTGSRQRFIDLPDGSELQCPEARLSVELADLAVFAEQSPTNPVVRWLDAHWWAALGSTISVCASLLLFYWLGSPYLASYVAERVDISYERKLGEQTLNALDRTKFSATELPAAQRAEMTRQFHALAAGLPQAANYRLEFRKGLGAASANAFALPGGLVVVTDAMFETCSNDGVLAVLAHEIGHVERRHVIRQALQDSSVSLLLSVITADLASVASSISDLPSAIAMNRYSRDMEREADSFAFSLLERHSLSPKSFANCMDRLSDSYEETRALNFLSTHPLSVERSARARARGTRAAPGTPGAGVRAE